MQQPTYLIYSKYKNGTLLKSCYRTLKNYYTANTKTSLLKTISSVKPRAFLFQEATNYTKIQSLSLLKTTNLAKPKAFLN